MAHTHKIVDSDNSFIIDPITRTISNNSDKVKLVQYDHNSERFTFQCPRMIEGHDMSLCTSVRVHYININKKTKETATGVYAVEDVAVSPDASNTIVFSWLISRNATKFVGTLSFLVEFMCTEEDATVSYAWHTDIYKYIIISAGMENGEVIEEKYPDILEEWKNEILAEIPIVSPHPITRIESLDSTNKMAIRSLEDGNYILYGYFQPYPDSDVSMTFASGSLVSVVNKKGETHAQVYYPYNNQVQYLKITDDSYERKNIYLNDLLGATLYNETQNLSTEDKNTALCNIGAMPLLYHTPGEVLAQSVYDSTTKKYFVKSFLTELPCTYNAKIRYDYLAGFKEGTISISKATDSDTGFAVSVTPANSSFGVPTIDAIKAINTGADSTDGLYVVSLSWTAEFSIVYPSDAKFKPISEYVLPDAYGLFWVTFTPYSSKYKSDQTYYDIFKAVKDGKLPVCMYPDAPLFGNKEIVCVYINEYWPSGGSAYMEFGADIETTHYYVRVMKNSDWVEYGSYRKEMVGADSSNSGKSGLVPTPQAGDETRYLRGDGTWVRLEAPVDKTLSVVGASADAATVGSRFASIPNVIGNDGTTVTYTDYTNDGTDGVSYVKVADDTPEFWELVGGFVHGDSVAGAPLKDDPITVGMCVRLSDYAYGLKVPYTGDYVLIVVATAATTVAPELNDPSATVEIPEAGIYFGGYYSDNRRLTYAYKLTYTKGRTIDPRYLGDAVGSGPLVVEVYFNDNDEYVSDTTPAEFLAAMETCCVELSCESMRYRVSYWEGNNGTFVCTDVYEGLNYASIDVNASGDALVFNVSSAENISWNKTSSAISGSLLLSGGTYNNWGIPEDFTATSSHHIQVTDTVAPYQELVGASMVSFLKKDDIINGTVVEELVSGVIYCGSIETGWVVGDNYAVYMDHFSGTTGTSGPRAKIVICSEALSLTNADTGCGDVVTTGPGIWVYANITIDGGELSDANGAVISLEYRTGSKIPAYFLPEGSGGAASNVLNVTVTSTNSGYTTTHTSTEIHDALIAGKTVNLQLVEGSNTYQLKHTNEYQKSDGGWVEHFHIVHTIGSRLIRYLSVDADTVTIHNDFEDYGSPLVIKWERGKLSDEAMSALKEASIASRPVILQREWAPSSYTTFYINIPLVDTQFTSGNYPYRWFFGAMDGGGTGRHTAEVTDDGTVTYKRILDDVSLGMTSAFGTAVGKIAQIAAVDTDGKPTQWKAVDMPSADTSLGLTSATIGQIAKITAVDTDGKPTAWEAVDIGDNVIMSSSTEGSTKKFRITVDDSGTLSAVEVTT